MAKIELGKKYVTKGGADARILCVDRDHPKFTVVALVANSPELFTENGKFFGDGAYHHLDLQEAPPPLKFPQFKRGDLVIVHNSNKTGFVRVFSHSDERYAYTFTSVFDGKCEVLAHWHNCEPFVPPEV